MRHIKLYERFNEAWEPKFDIATILDAIEWEDNYSDLYPGYSDEPGDFTEETYYDTKEEAEEAANQIIDILSSLPNPIPVYRAIKANDRDDIDTEDLGESWSYDRDSAINFGSHNSSNFLLSGEVNKEDVNWTGTIKAYVIFSGGYSDDDENEIVVDDSNSIKNLKIEDI